MNTLSAETKAILAPFVQTPATKKARKTTQTFHYTLCGVGLACELDYESASGDGWNEPREEANAYLCEAFIGDTDIFDLLSAEQCEEIETAFLEQEPEYDVCDEPDFGELV